ncbi:MAG: hypothetical protein JWO82_19 [Akkermansiaceae bacterium]|nr:hypothetical protein [Akkermansiaceae bacterium]
MAEYLRKYRKKAPRRQWWRAAVVAILLLTGAVWGAQIWLGRKIESVMSGELAKRGLQFQHGLKTWDPWRGLHLRDVAIHYADGAPMLEIENVAVSFPLGQFIGRGEKISHWRISEAKVMLSDAEGGVWLQDVSLQVDARPGELDVISFEGRKDGLNVAVKGKVRTRQAAESGVVQPFRLSLKALRGTLTALKVKADTGPFKVTGDFAVDASKPEVPWSANLHGAGGKLEWQELAVQSAQADAVLTQDESKITADLTLGHGAGSFTLSRKDWQEAPFVFSGTLKDQSGRSDAFNGTYVAATKRLAIEHFKGPADLWALAQDFPAVAAKLPDQVSFETFPEIELKKVVREGGENNAHWVIGSATMDGQAKLGVKDHQLVVSRISGGAEFDGNTWLLEEVQAKIFGGDVTVSGRYAHPQLTKSRVNAEALKLSELKRWTDGEAASSKGLLSIDYRGNINLAEQDLEGQGSMKLDNAPVFDAPLLEQTYDLFDAIFPGLQRSKTGEFQADFTAHSGKIDVTRFEARGGTLTVSAKGQIDLSTKRVEGTARGKLTGVKGVVTSPLSRLLEMNVGGPFDDIRVKPLGPVKLASNAANGTVGAATSTLKEGGKVVGTVIVEGAKLPFRLFGEKGRKDDDGDKSGEESGR